MTTPTSPDRREVRSRLDLSVTEPATLALQVAVADEDGREVEERLSVESDGRPVQVRELHGPHGARLHVVSAPVGRLVVDYAASVSGHATGPATDELELLTYLRPSRYSESDRLAAIADREFRGLGDPRALLAGVSSWVGARLFYVPGSSGPTDGAVDTLLAGQGVCRDYAHLVVAMLRALDVPSRLVSAYAPGLDPMDFHAVAEAHIDGAWHVVDATLLAPRSSLVRIATGRDAADTAFLSVYDGRADLVSTQVEAVTVGRLPGDDPREFVTLG